MDLRKIFPKWDRIDEMEVCPACGNIKITKRMRGITKQNVRRLFRPKWTINEVIITFLIFMILVMAMLYKLETQQARDFIKDFNANPQKYCETIKGFSELPYPLTTVANKSAS